MLDLPIITDTATRLVVRSNPDGPLILLLPALVFGVMTFAGVQLHRRARALAWAVFAVTGALALWTGASFITTGGIIDEFSMDQATNQLVTRSFYARTGAPEHPAAIRPLDQVLRSDLSPGKGGGAIVITMRSGERIFPFGTGSGPLSNEFYILSKMQALTSSPPEHGDESGSNAGSVPH